MKVRARSLRIGSALASMLLWLLLGAPTGASAGPNGDLDPSFGSGGEVVARLGIPVETWDMLDAGRHLLVLGRSLVTHEKLVVARFRSDGALDTTFGRNGKVIVGFGGRGVTTAFFTRLPNGRIVVGTTSIERRVVRPDLGLARLLPDGELDPSFGHGGRVVLPIPNGGAEWTAIARQGDGKLVVAGTQDAITNGFQTWRFAVARLDPGGGLDTTYGHGGVAIFGFPNSPGRLDSNSSAADLAIDSEGRAVVAGSTTSNRCQSRIAVARLTPEGSLDPSFGGDGRVATKLSNDHSFAQAVQVDDDARITVAGANWQIACHRPQPINGGAAVVRYLPDGHLDPTFGGDGTVATSFFGRRGSGPVFADLALTDGGGVVAAGTATDSTNGDSEAVVASFAGDGSLDPAFSGDGRAVAAVTGGVWGVAAVADDPSGRPVVAGANYRERMFLLRFRALRSGERSAGNAGKFRVPGA